MPTIYRANIPYPPREKKVEYEHEKAPPGKRDGKSHCVRCGNPKSCEFLTCQECRDAINAGRGGRSGVC